jgi:membrane fusion protein (multidrug efflux system)
MADRRPSAGKRAFKTLLTLLLIAGVGAGAFYGYRGYLQPMLAGDGAQQAASQGRPPPTVTATKAVRSDWQPSLQATGTLRAERGVEVTPEINGVVAEVGMRSGAAVEEGDLLVRMQAPELKAQLKALRAQRSEALSAFRRAQRLYDQGNTSQARLDETRARYQSLDAQIAEQQARIDKKTVRAPFSGQLGITEVDVGQYLQAGQPLVSLQDLTPIDVNFTLPEQTLPRVSVGQTVRVRVDAYPDMQFTGEVTAIDPQVRESTRNYTVQATLSNDGRRLRPGMFARVSLQTGEPERLVTLPQTAIVTNPYGASVFVVQRGDDGSRKVTQQRVETGSQRGTQIAITKGLSGGETVVTSGQIKLREGVAVQIKDGPQPTNTAEAQVEEP